MNNDIHVDPHITQYTVYITDNYTGNNIVKENVTETQFTLNTQDDGLCPMCQVSATNAGGEGEMSEQVQEHNSGKQAKDLWTAYTSYPVLNQPKLSLALSFVVLFFAYDVHMACNLAFNIICVQWVMLSWVMYIAYVVTYIVTYTTDLKTSCLYTHTMNNCT